jgi:hypothetical protein
VGRAPALLGAAIALLLGLYYGFSSSLWSASQWWNVAFIACVLMPMIFGLVWLALPLRHFRYLWLVALACGAVAAIAVLADAQAVGDFAKLGGITAAAFWLLSFLEELVVVVVVAAIIPWVDAWSVWRGPTRDVVTGHKAFFADFAFSFPLPGQHLAAELGMPDLLFFALFLAAADRFRLRVGWTWLTMLVLLGSTLAASVAADVTGLPALPALSIGFLAPNADLIWRQLRARRGGNALPDVQ